VKQPTKSDLLTRWVALAGNEKPAKDTRKDFDEWYKKKGDEGHDHLWMIQVLTKKLHEKNQAQKDAENKDGQDGQASDK
jgi:hypothetical protein